MEFVIPVWNPHTKTLVCRVEMVQRRVAQYAIHTIPLVMCPQCWRSQHGGPAKMEITWEMLPRCQTYHDVLWTLCNLMKLNEKSNDFLWGGGRGGGKLIEDMQRLSKLFSPPHICIMVNRRPTTLHGDHQRVATHQTCPYLVSTTLDLCPYWQFKLTILGLGLSEV